MQVDLDPALKLDFYVECAFENGEKPLQHLCVGLTPVPALSTLDLDMGTSGDLKLASLIISTRQTGSLHVTVKRNGNPDADEKARPSRRCALINCAGS
jgi:hypothetical protein